MKTPRWTDGAVALLAAAAFVAPVLGEEAKMKSTFLDPDSAEAKPYRDVGSRAIDRLAYTMITDAASAVSQNAEVAALGKCHLKDIPMTPGVGGIPRISAMKLTSLKLRNPANAPDDAEKEALEKVNTLLIAGIPPKVLVQRVELASGQHEWRVYKPLANVRQCGTCHAKPDEQSPEMRTALKERFPADQASDYSGGQWRGLMRVTVADPPPPPAAAPAATTAPTSDPKGLRRKKT